MIPPSTILIVDDNLIGRKILEGLLIDHGYNLIFADSGEEALKQAARITPDLILLDIMMPNMDGYEVCRRLRSDPLLSEIPIVMVTALDDQESRIKGIESGADDFISKPFNDTELLARVRAITRLNRYRTLLTEKTQFEWMVENTDDGYIIITQNDDILYANPQAQSLLNIFPVKKALNKEKFFSLIQKEYLYEPQESWQNWPASISENNEQQNLYLVRPETPTSHTLWLLVTIQKYEAIPEPKYLVRLINVTTFMENQRDMVTFHRIINHRVKSPLHTIQLALDVLTDKNIEMPEIEALELVNTAIENAKQLQTEIQEILDFLETPDDSNKEETFNLSDLEKTIAEISKDLDIISFQINISENLNSKQIGLSKKDTESIFMELLENAKKFHPTNQPNITVNATLINENKINILISDNGISLSPEQLSNAWLPYYEGNKFNPAKRLGTGMGLGLALVASLVWQLGGECSIYNRESGSGGVSVELILPLLL